MVSLLYSSLIICFFGFILSRKQAKTEGIIKTIQSHPFGVLLGIFCATVFVILMTANRVGFDAANFKFIYDYVCRNSTNPWDYSYETFVNLIIIFNRFIPGLSYYEFHAYILCILFVVLYCYYDKIVYCFFSVCFLYLVSGVYASDGIQFKNFISACLLSCALIYLVEQGKKNIIKFYTIVLMATLLHFSFAIYFFLPLVMTRGYQKIKKFIPCIGVLLYLVLFLGGGGLASGILLLLSKIPIMSKLSHYSGTIAGQRSLVPVLIYILALIVLYFCRQEKERLSEKREKFMLLMWNIWLLMGICLPALLYANAVYRIYRNLYIPMFVVLSNCVVSMPRLCKKRMLYSLVVLVFSLILYYYPIMLRQGVDVYDPVIEGEYFWEN